MIFALYVLVGSSLAQPLLGYFFRHCFIFGISVCRGFAEAKTRSWDVGFRLLARGIWACTLGICVCSSRVWAQTL